MPKSKNLKALAHSLSTTDGVCLRYVVSTRDQPVEATKLTNQIEWSPLPKTYLEAREVLEALVKLKLVSKQGKRSYTFTKLGESVIQYANENKLWRSPIAKPDSRIHIKKGEVNS